MLKKGNKLYSILTGSCPKCHSESMYKDQNPYKMANIFNMHENCSHCNTKYKMEPSFFYGAMYVSYSLSIAFSVAAFIISFLWIQTSLFVSFLCIVATLIGFMPIIMRLSRNIWINMFIKYNATAVKKK